MSGNYIANKKLDSTKFNYQSGRYIPTIREIYTHTGQRTSTLPIYLMLWSMCPQKPLHSYDFNEDALKVEGE